MIIDKAIETIYGKGSKFEVMMRAGTFATPEIYIRKDGQYHRGPFPSIQDALEAAKKEAEEIGPMPES